MFRSHAFNHLISQAFASVRMLAAVVFSAMLLLLVASTVSAQEVYTIRIQDPQGAVIPAVNVVGNQQFQGFSNSVGELTINLADYEGPLHLVFTHLQAGLEFSPAEIDLNTTQCPGRVCQIVGQESSTPTVALELSLYQSNVLVPDADLGAWGAISPCPMKTDQNGVVVRAVPYRANGCNNGDADRSNDFITLFGISNACSLSTPYLQTKMRVCPNREYNRVVIDRSCSTPATISNGYKLQVKNVLNNQGLAGVNFYFNMGVNQASSATKTDFQGSFLFRPASLGLNASASYQAVPVLPGYVFFPASIKVSPGANPQNTFTFHAIPDYRGSGAVYTRLSDENGQALGAATVQASPFLGCGQSLEQVTDSRGEAVFPVLRNSNCLNGNQSIYDNFMEVTAIHPTCSTPHEQLALSICSNEGLSQSNIPADCSGSVGTPILFSGTVTRPDGSRFAGVDVYDAGVRIASSDQQGKWSAYLEPGKTRILEAHNVQQGYVFDPQKVGFVAANQHHLNVNFNALFEVSINPVPAPPACPVKEKINISGTVFDKMGNRIEGAIIFNNHEQVATTNYRGEYAFEAVPLSDLWITVNEQDEIFFADPAGWSFVQTECDKAFVDFRQTDVESIILSGTAYHWDSYRNTLGPPHALVEITAYIGEERVIRKTQTRSDGSYLISVPMDSSFVISAAAQGYQVTPGGHSGEADVHRYDLDFVTQPIGIPVCSDGDDTDTDKDGIPDCIDGCPSDPKKLQAGSCGCGVADSDTDNDGALDCHEQCDRDPAKVVPGVCGCGLSDRDSDLDGFFDCLDECPFDPAKQAAGVCGCGVSDRDTDGDGTFDCNDSCLADPNKVAPGLCGCGVFETDSDGDGMPDCVDQCGSDPTKVQPGICGCGVSDKDSDGDGTPDCNDSCELDAGKIEAGECGCGTADNDSDFDGVLDCFDLCPFDPLKLDAGHCGCGIPDEDKNEDQIFDCDQSPIELSNICDRMLPPVDPQPDPEPTAMPTNQPTSQPTTEPTAEPTSQPTTSPTPQNPGDGQDGDDSDKVFLCHQPPGNVGNAHTIHVGFSAVQAHLNHGDYLGECTSRGKAKSQQLRSLQTTSTDLNWWRLKNSFAETVLLTVKLLNSSFVSTLELAGYEDVIISTPALPGDNTLVIFIGDKEIARLTSREMRCEYMPPLEELTVRPLCSEDAASSSRWEIYNPYIYTLTLGWKIVDTTQSGTLQVAAGGKVTFSTPNQGQTRALLQLDYYGHQLLTIQSQGEQCPYPPINAAIVGECLNDVKQDFLRWRIDNQPNNSKQAQNVTAAWQIINSDPLEQGNLELRGVSSAILETSRKAGNNILELQFATEQAPRTLTHQLELCENIIRPIVVSQCSQDPLSKQNWLIHNTLSRSASYTWMIENSSQTGSLTLASDERSSLSTDSLANGQENTLLLFEEGRLMARTTSAMRRCDVARPAPTPTATPIPPGCGLLADSGPALWRATGPALSTSSSNGHSDDRIAVWEYKSAGSPNRMILIHEFATQKRINFNLKTLSGSGINGALALNRQDYARVIGGSRVIFEGMADNLVAHDANGAWDVLIYDYATDQIRVPNPHVHQDENGGTSSGQISPDGKYAAMIYYYNKNVSAEKNILLYNWEEDQSKAILSESYTGFLKLLSISDDFVLYLLNDSETGENSLFEYNIQSGETLRRSIGAAGQILEGARAASISKDSRFVAYLARDPISARESLYVYDRMADAVVDLRSLLSSSEDLALGEYFEISNTGELVFSSASSSLVAGDRNAVRDIFVFDAIAYRLSRVVDQRGAGFIKPSDRPHISPDGNAIAFENNVGLNNDARNGLDQRVYLFNRRERSIQDVTANAQGGLGPNGYNTLRELTDQGNVVFDSAASNLIDNDLNGATDVFMSRDIDMCPCDAYKIYPGACGCGIADIDDDGDGIFECRDTSFDPISPPKVDLAPSIIASCSVTSAYNRIWTINNPFTLDIEVQVRLKYSSFEANLIIPARSTNRISTPFLELQPDELELYYQGRMVDSKVLSDQSCLGDQELPYIASSCLVSGAEAAQHGYVEAIRYTIVNPSGKWIPTEWIESPTSLSGLELINPNGTAMVYTEALRSQPGLLQLYFDEELVDSERGSFITCAQPEAIDICESGAVEVIDFASGAGADPTRLEAGQALGLPQYDDQNVVSLGQAGVIELGFKEKAVYDKPLANDFWIASASFQTGQVCNTASQRAKVYVSQDRLYWKLAGEVSCRGGFIDIARTGLPYVIAVRIVDDSAESSESFKLDALGCEPPQPSAEPEPEPEPEPIDPLCSLSGSLKDRKGRELKAKEIARLSKATLIVDVRNESSLVHYKKTLEAPFVYTFADLAPGTYSVRIEDQSGQMIVASNPKVYRDVLLDVAKGTCDQGGMYFAMKPSRGQEKVKGQKPAKSKGSSASGKTSGAKSSASGDSTQSKKPASQKAKSKKSKAAKKAAKKKK